MQLSTQIKTHQLEYRKSKDDDIKIKYLTSDEYNQLLHKLKQKKDYIDINGEYIVNNKINIISFGITKRNMNDFAGGKYLAYEDFVVGKILITGEIVKFGSQKKLTQKEVNELQEGEAIWEMKEVMNDYDKEKKKLLSSVLNKYFIVYGKEYNIQSKEIEGLTSQYLQNINNFKYEKTKPGICA